MSAHQLSLRRQRHMHHGQRSRVRLQLDQGHAVNAQINPIAGRFMCATMVYQHATRDGDRIIAGPRGSIRHAMETADQVSVRNASVSHVCGTRRAACRYRPGQRQLHDRWPTERR